MAEDPDPVPVLRSGGDPWSVAGRGTPET